ncbi:MAG TPA: hypothetical protein P5567_00095 [Kiritimatiellia bacterium]|nr:hypothetical protein [Kiritimatiellia bacterium]HRZ10836.1 hypothetical protein [Kiritimatiellia bacterium]HSA18891.1 hypothetical protein [Kiritimatiellia bacterium]
MKKFVALFLLVVLLLPAARAADLPPVMVTVEIRGIDALAEQVGLLASDVGAPLTKEAVLQTLGGFMMAPDFQGLATDGTIRLFVMDPQSAGSQGEPPVLISLPVKGDGSEYLEAVSTFMKPGEAVEGVTEYTADPASPSPLPLQSVFVAPVDGQLLVGAQQSLVRDGVQALGEGKLASANLPASGTIVFSVPCRRNADKLEPLIEQIAQSATATPTEAPIDAARVVQAEFKALIKLLRQTENVMIGLKADGNALTLSTLVEPAAGTVLQRVIGELRVPSAKVASLVPGNALMAASGFFVLPDEFLEGYAEMTDEMYGAMGEPFAGLAPVVREGLEAIKGQFAGDYAFGVVPGSGNLPVDIIQVAAIRDTDQVKAAVEKMTAAMQKMMDAASTQAAEGAEKPPFSMKFDIGEARSYEGVDITPYHYVIELPEEAKNEIPEFLSKWFTDLKYELAYVDNHIVYTLGSSKAMDGVIDALKGGGGVPVSADAACRALLPDLTASATDVSWIKILDIVRTFMRAVPDVPAELVDGLPATSLMLAGFSQAENGNLASHIRLSRSDLAAMAQYFQSMAASRMQAAQGIEVEETMIEDEGTGETIEEIDVEAADEAAAGEATQEEVEVEEE